MVLPRPENEDAGGYRYGFNGKERDNEGLGGGGSTYDYGFRIYNAQIGRFLSIDPLGPKFPMLTPYQYASNNPIMSIDLDGLESLPANSRFKKGTGNVIIVIGRPDPTEFAPPNFQPGKKAWDYVAVNSFTEAEQWLESTYGKKNKKIKNLIVYSHGPWGAGAVGPGVIVNDDQNTWANSEDPNGAGKLNTLVIQSSDIQKFKEKAPDVEKVETPLEQVKNSEIQSLENIGGFLDAGADVCFTTCDLGQDPNIGTQLFDLMLPEDGNLYLSNTETFFFIGAGDKNNLFRFNESGTQAGFYDAWSQTNKNGTAQLPETEVIFESDGNKGDIKPISRPRPKLDESKK